MGDVFFPKKNRTVRELRENAMREAKSSITPKTMSAVRLKLCGVADTFADISPVSFIMSLAMKFKMF